MRNSLWEKYIQGEAILSYVDTDVSAVFCYNILNDGYALAMFACSWLGGGQFSVQPFK
jgi:hypothetical protein